MCINLTVIFFAEDTRRLQFKTYLKRFPSVSKDLVSFRFFNTLMATSFPFSLALYTLENPPSPSLSQEAISSWLTFPTVLKPDVSANNIIILVTKF